MGEYYLNLIRKGFKEILCTDPIWLTVGNSDGKVRIPQNARNFCTHFTYFSVESSGRNFGNGKNLYFQQNVQNFMTSCVTLALEKYVCSRDIVIGNSPYQSLKHLNASWIKRDTNLISLAFFISLFHAQHVSDVNTSILRSLGLICWVISWVVLFWYDACWCYVVVWLGWCGILMQAEAVF